MKKNRVSVWLGNFLNDDLFQSYISKTHDGDGNSFSKFMDEFIIDFYDEDFQDAFFQTELNFRTELNDLSYSKSFIHNVNPLVNNCNAVICLYDFEYNISNNSLPNLTMKFAGTFDYNKNA